MNIYFPFNPHISHEIFSDLDCGPRSSDYSNYQKLLITSRCLTLLTALRVKPNQITQLTMLDNKSSREEWLVGQSQRQLSLLQYIGHIYLHLLNDPISGLRKPQRITVQKVAFLAQKTVTVLRDRSKLYCRAAIREGVSFEKLLNGWIVTNQITRLQN